VGRGRAVRGVLSAWVDTGERYFISRDAGQTWDFQGTPIVRGDMKHGLGNPNSKSQTMVRSCCPGRTRPAPLTARSLRKCEALMAAAGRTRGTRWQVVSEPIGLALAVVSRLPNGHFFMTYEMAVPPIRGRPCADLKC
jgi:hypothetical protein